MHPRGPVGPNGVQVCVDERVVSVAGIARSPRPATVTPELDATPEQQFH
jgi:hypothetical protein